MNYPAICIHILLQTLSIVNSLSLVNFSKIKGRNIGKMWFTQDSTNGPYNTITLWCDNMPGAEH